MDIEELKEAARNLEFIASVNPNWSHGRNCGLNDDATEMLADQAFDVVNRGIHELIDFYASRQSVKSEDVAEAIDQVEGTRRKAQKELDSLTETKSRYDHQIEIGDPWNWKWEESWHPLAVEGHKQTIKNANLVIAALQAYQPWIPVSERLPKNSEHDWVLAQITEDNGYMWIPKVVEYRERIGDWYCEELGWLKTHNGTFKVTHWKPLPEPPKGE